MVNLVQKFVSCCRAAGARISTSEVLDCITQLEMIDLLEEPQFRATLRSNFAKSRREQKKFDDLYALFFHELHQDARMFQADSSSSYSKEILEMLNSVEDQGQINQAIADFLSGDPLAFLNELDRIQSEGEALPQGFVRFNLGPLAGRLEIMIQLNAVRDMIMQYLHDNRGRILWEARRALRTHFEKRLDSAFRMLIRDSRPYSEDVLQVKSYEQHLNQLGQKPFANLTPKEVEEMREVIDQLVRKLKDIVSRRYASRERGVLDVKRTLHRAARYHGVPLEIQFRSRTRRKGKVVTLCDVSSSVWSAARFMLNMLYSLQECFTQVRSFIFVAGLAEVTETFERNEINQAIEKVLKETDIHYNASTDYGETFRHFKRAYLDVLNKKTTLIIIGDGRSNYFNPEEEILEEMREKCRRLIWLNPEPEQVWYTGDSEMRTYEAYCHEIRPCRNLNQLVDFIEDLVL